MTKEQKLAALDFAIEVLQQKREKIAAGDVTTNGPIDDPCPAGQIRNAQGQCVDDI